MSKSEEPADAVLSALDQWQMVSWREIEAAVTDAATEPDWQGSREAALLLWQQVVDSARQILGAMHGQSLSPSLMVLLQEFAADPINAGGLDARRVGITRIGGDELRRHLDAEMLRHLAHGFVGRSETDMARYELLFIAAWDEPKQLMPIAHDYLTRAARLLLLGLNVECVVFCRAALEAALKQRVDDDAMVARGFTKRVAKKKNVVYDYDLYTRILEARTEPALFDESLYDRALVLKDDGNRAVHPDAEKTYVTPLNAVASFATLALAVRKLLVL